MENYETSLILRKYTGLFGEMKEKFKGIFISDFSPRNLCML